MDYVHGYSARDTTRLADQAGALAGLLHARIAYPAGSHVLEAGCGVGAQTVILAASSPRATFTCVDISAESLGLARQRVRDAGVGNVRFARADIFGLPFRSACFDHVFVCFVLEHLPRPAAALMALRQFLRPGGSLTVIEGDHGTALLHPDSGRARRVIQCLIDLQLDVGGDPLIGRRLYPLLVESGYRDVSVSPRLAYADASRPDLADGITRKTFTAMVEGAGQQAVSRGMIDQADWVAGVSDLYRAAEPDGTFCYTFFKATAVT